MKKTIILVFSAVLIIFLCQEKSQKVIIPKNSIRIRIIANSNSSTDLLKKMQIKDEIENKIYDLLKDVNSIEEAREIISLNLDKLNIILEEETDDFKISFGNNYFPKKVYKDVIYEEGNYESLVITLGQGKGDNWWCVLFPPLCLLENNDNTKDVEYKFFIKEIIDKYKNNN